MIIEKLIFVYNAKAGKINAALDSAHKILSPSTYECKLCDLTFDVFKENEEWGRFRESVTTTTSVQQLEFLHRDEFEKQYKSKWLPKYDYPVILTATENGLEIFMNSVAMKQINTTTDLINNINSKIKLL
ncbi:GTPase [Nonlabens antarcticus]|uniref:GTPase n=1 Tax=Nonlabens antarcticus TaxID=392714 RepID=UPI001E3CF60B|nr:GTPase [Nonlabens antarcticus]